VKLFHHREKNKPDNVLKKAQMGFVRNGVPVLRLRGNEKPLPQLLYRSCILMTNISVFLFIRCQSYTQHPDRPPSLGA